MKQLSKRRAVLISFIEEDEQGVQFPNNDAIVITLNMKNYNVRCILFDNGNLNIVLYFHTLIKMGISPDRLTLVDPPLVGFTRDAI